ncbi:MAG: PEP-CTERM sorting domain-containing protein [Planctomycetaceae bacterium]|nr:PEP-CTERM sorting domain-containing protein [Planctomycetaceae bacterium]
MPALLLAGQCQAGPVPAIDGDLRDWGVVNASNASHSRSGWSISTMTDRLFYTTSPGTYTGSGGFTFEYVREDTDDSWDESKLIGPNLGGQNYDTEFLAAGIANNTLYIAISTGQRRDNGLASFSPGDIYIETTDFSIYGVEVGGGAGNTSSTNVWVKGSADPMAPADSPGSTYTLNSNGHTSAHTSSTSVGSSHVAGSVWLTQKSDWILDPIATGTPDANWPLPGHTIGKDPVQLQLNGGTYVGQSEFVYRMTSDLGQKAIIEVAIPMSFFPSGVTLRGVTWGPSCGNDMLHVPEPATFGLLLTGAMGFAGLRKSRRKAA